MEVNLNTRRLPSVGAPEAAPRSETVAAGRDSAAFANTRALQRALTLIPDTRPEVVEQARQLVASINYPPPKAVDSIAVLLAMHLKKTP